jgi:hypothetical protein
MTIAPRLAFGLAAAAALIAAWANRGQKDLTEVAPSVWCPPPAQTAGALGFEANPPRASATG